MSRALVLASTDVVAVDGESIEIPVYAMTSADKMKRRVLSECVAEDGESIEESDYDLVMMVKDSRGVVKAKRPLPPSFPMKELAGYYERTNVAEEIKDSISLFLARKDQKIAVYFNLYCRMTSGCPFTTMDFYYAQDTCVDDMEQAIKSNMGLTPFDDRFGLYGRFPDGIKKLDAEERISDLSEEWGDKISAFFQYQIMSSFVDMASLGATISGELKKISSSGNLFKPVGKYWWALRGTNLYCYEHANSLKAIKFYKDIHRCDVFLSGDVMNAKFGGVVFEILHPQKHLKLIADKIQTAENWIKSIKNCDSVKNEYRNPELGESSVLEKKTAKPVEIDYNSFLDLYDNGGESVFDDAICAVYKEGQHLISKLNKKEQNVSTKSLVALVKGLLGQCISLPMASHADEMITCIYEIIVNLKMVTEGMKIFRETMDTDSKSSVEMSLQALCIKCQELGPLADKIERAAKHSSAEVEDKHKDLIEKLKKTLLEEPSKEKEKKPTLKRAESSKTSLNAMKSRAMNAVQVQQRAKSLEEPLKADDLIIDAYATTYEVKNSPFPSPATSPNSVISLSDKYESLKKQFSNDLYSCKPCSKCGDSVLIEDAVYSAYSVFHSRCFCCQDCGAELLPGSCLLVSGLPKCKGLTCL